MMRFIRQLFGCSRRAAQAEELKRLHQVEFRLGERKVRAQRIVLERLVAQLEKDNTWPR